MARGFLIHLNVIASYYTEIFQNIVQFLVFGGTLGSSRPEPGPGLVSHHAAHPCKIDLSFFTSLKSGQERKPGGYKKCKELLFQGRERASVVCLFADYVHF